MLLRILAFGLVALSFGLSAPARAAEHALLVYSSLEPDYLAELKKAFEADNPDVEIRWQRDATGVITARLLAEKGQHGDVIWGLAATSMMRLKTSC